MVPPSELSSPVRASILTVLVGLLLDDLPDGRGVVARALVAIRVVGTIGLDDGFDTGLGPRSLADVLGH